VREGLRTTAGLVVETGSAREVHHFAVLAGYGAEAVHPYLAMETLARHAPGAAGRAVGRQGDLQLRQGHRQGPVEDHVQDGHQHVHVVLRRPDLRGHRPARRTSSRSTSAAPPRQVGGIGVFEVAEEALRMHRAAFGDDPVLARMLDAGGEYAWRVRGEEHMWTPDAIAKLQHSTRAGKFDTYKEYAQIINDQSQAPHDAARPVRVPVDPSKAIPLDEVEPAAEIVKRFATGAMSLGSISTEAHSTLAIAMNRIGGKSNTGEGGEDPARYRNELKGIRSPTAPR
jgi:glutamate synthase (NADPH/NADH) large chain